MGKMNLDINLISKEVAVRVNQSIIGFPTENRVVIVSPSETERVTDSGLFIPGTVKEGVPRKGVIVKMGEITEEYKSLQHQLHIGDVITYGLYAGKELEPNFKNEVKEVENQTFTVLSTTEIIYIEPNRK